MSRVAAFALPVIAAGMGIAALVGTHAPTPAPLQVTLTLDGTLRTCPAQSFAFDKAGGVSTLVIEGMACAVDSIFRSNFEVTP